MQPLRSTKGGGQATLAVIALICIVVAGYFIIKQSKTKDETPYSNAYYYCPSCEKEFTGVANLIPPVKCPFCKQVTGARLRKYRCKQCNNVFPAFLTKFDVETKRLIERRERGESVADTNIGSELIAEFGTDDWVDASSQEGLDIVSSVVCPKCGSADAVPIFPKSKGKK
jgi:hypothetical protein